MPNHVTGGTFDYADAHRTYTTRELTDMHNHNTCMCDDCQHFWAAVDALAASIRED